MKNSKTQWNLIQKNTSAVIALAMISQSIAASPAFATRPPLDENYSAEDNLACSDGQIAQFDKEAGAYFDSNGYNAPSGVKAHQCKDGSGQWWEQRLAYYVGGNGELRRKLVDKKKIDQPKCVNDGVNRIREHAKSKFDTTGALPTEIFENECTDALGKTWKQEITFRLGKVKGEVKPIMHTDLVGFKLATDTQVAAAQPARKRASAPELTADAPVVAKEKAGGRKIVKADDDKTAEGHHGMVEEKKSGHGGLIVAGIAALAAAGGGWYYLKNVAAKNASRAGMGAARTSGEVVDITARDVTPSMRRDVVVATRNGEMPVSRSSGLSTGAVNEAGIVKPGDNSLDVLGGTSNKPQLGHDKDAGQAK